MGNYFNPPDHVIQVGKKLISSPTYAEVVQQLPPNTQLIGLYDRFIFKNAPHLYCEAEFNEFSRQVDQGNIALLGYYAITEEDYVAHVR